MSEQPNFSIIGEWLCERVDGCTCEGGYDIPHRPECGWEPVAKLADIVAQEQRIAAVEQKLRTEKAGAAEANEAMLHYARRAGDAEASQRWDSEQVTEAALTAIAAETDLPYMVRSEHYPNIDAIRAADEEAERLNLEFAARVVAAVRAALAVPASPEDTTDDN